MLSIAEWQTKINEWAIRKEWRGPKASQRPLVADFMLMVSEIAEALEELRKHPDPHHAYFTWTAKINGVKFPNLRADQLNVLKSMELAADSFEVGPGKPEGVGPELADLAIRLFDTCEEYGLDLEHEIIQKQEYNEGREIKHGGLHM